MAQDRYAALAAWRALSVERRRAAWQAAAKPTPIEDPELAAVVARYAAAKRGQVPAVILVVALAALFGWLAVAVYWMTSVAQGVGIVLAGTGVIAAGLGIGALQVRQANFDRLYAVAIAPLRRKPNGLPEGHRTEERHRTGDDRDLDDRAVGPRRVGHAGADERTGGETAEVTGDGDAGHADREDQVDHDDRQDRRGTQA